MVPSLRDDEAKRAKAALTKGTKPEGITLLHQDHLATMAYQSSWRTIGPWGQKSQVVRSIYDPTAGTGGMLSVADDHLQAMNHGAKLVMYGQELNDESYAICKADMLIKGQEVTNIVAGNTLSEDGHAGRKFDYLISNPWTPTTTWPTRC